MKDSKTPKERDALKILYSELIEAGTPTIGNLVYLSEGLYISPDGKTVELDL